MSMMMSDCLWLNVLYHSIQLTEQHVYIQLYTVIYRHLSVALESVVESVISDYNPYTSVDVADVQVVSLSDVNL